MSFNSTHCRQDAYVVLAFGRNGVDELVFAQKVVAALLVLLRVFHESCAGELRQLGLVGGPQQHLAYLLRDRRHGEKMGAAWVVGRQLASGPGREAEIGIGRTARGEVVSRPARRVGGARAVAASFGVKARQNYP